MILISFGQLAPNSLPVDCLIAIERAVPILRKLKAMLFMLIATLAFSVPVAPSIAHNAGHTPTSGPAQAHFGFFVDLAAVEDGDSTTDFDDRSAQDRVGHSHPPISMADPGLLASVHLAFPSLGGELPQEWSVNVLPTRSWTPDERPPRA